MAFIPGARPIGLPRLVFPANPFRVPVREIFFDPDLPLLENDLRSNPGGLGEDDVNDLIGGFPFPSLSLFEARLIRYAVPVGTTFSQVGFPHNLTGSGFVTWDTTSAQSVPSEYRNIIFSVTGDNTEVGLLSSTLTTQRSAFRYIVNLAKTQLTGDPADMTDPSEAVRIYVGLTTTTSIPNLVSTANPAGKSIGFYFDTTISSPTEWHIASDDGTTFETTATGVEASNSGNGSSSAESAVWWNLDIRHDSSLVVNFRINGVSVGSLDWPEDDETTQWRFFIAIHRGVPGARGTPQLLVSYIMVDEIGQEFQGAPPIPLTDPINPKIRRRPAQLNQS